MCDEEFGGGVAGASARIIVEGMEPCAECHNASNITVDFDLFGDLCQIPCCGAQVCIEAIRQTAISIMEARGQVDTYNTFGFNGRGRA